MSGKVQRPEEASEKLPTPNISLSPRSFLFFFAPPLRGRRIWNLLVGSSIVLIVLEWYAQSRRTMNSKPSEDMRVTYVEGSVIIIAACL